MKITTKNLGVGLALLSILLIILLGSVKINSDKQSAALCELTSEAGLPMEDCPAHHNPNSWFLTLAFGIAFMMFGSGIYLLIPSKVQLDKSFKKINPGLLDDEEQKVYDFIKEKEGSAYQSDIIKTTNFSKVKVSRILDHLENKNILERKRRGMTNIVVLK